MPRNKKISDKELKQNNPLFSYLPYLLLFLTSFIFFVFFADHVCFYQEKTSLFVFSHDFLIDNLHQPGLLLLYLGNFVTTFFFNPIIGALIISFLILLIPYIISRIITYLSGYESVLIPLLFGTSIYFLQTNYQFLIYNSLGLLLQISLFYITIRYLKVWLPAVMLPVWYFVNGGFAWIFCLMFTTYILVNSLKKNWIKILFFWAVGFLVIYFSKEYIFFQPASVLLKFPISDSNTGSQLRIFLLIGALIVLLPFIIKFRIPSFNKIRIAGYVKRIGPVLLLTLILISVIIVRYDKKVRQYFHVEKLFFENRFNDVNEYLIRNPSKNKLTIYLNNIALCETGKLNDQLFRYQQSADGGTLFLKWEMLGEVLRRGGYFYYTIGMINEAHRWAYENMVMDGLTPGSLKMLIKTEIINGNYKVASKYISILEKTLCYRDDAKRFAGLLISEKAIDSDIELKTKRKEKIQHDFFSITDNPYMNIERVLALDSLNKKAFEYKLAYHLLKKDYKAIVAELPKLAGYGFTRIPAHLEEAALVYKRLKSGILPSGLNLEISQTTESRFNELMQTLQNYGNNPKTAQPFLRQKFADTFWYYVFYH